MARTVKPTFKQWIPGAGRTAGGVPVQGKTRTVGRISVTNYSQEGESLKPADVGLTTIHYISLKVRDEAQGGADAQFASYSASAQQFYLWDTTGAGTNAKHAVASEEVDFVAEGDSVMDVELL